MQSVTCYNYRPILLHGYLAPFFLLQALVYYYFSIGDTTNLDSKIIHDGNTDVINNNENNNNSILESHTFEAAQRHSYEIWVIAVTVSIAAQIITYLFCHWSVDVKCLLSYSKCKDPFKAAFAKVTPTPNNGSTELVTLRRETIAKKSTLWFMFQKTKYVYDDKSNKFVTIEFSCDEKISHYKQWKGYNDQNEIQLIERQYGRNELDMVIPEFKELFIERATAPFFVFQTFCVGLWCLDEFWYYAIFTLFMLVTFEVVLVKHQLRNMQEIRRMGNQPFTVQVFRQGKWKPIKSDQLIAGDLVNIVRSDHNIPCDILLIRGSCIIDESTLTGESVPQMKEPIEDIDDDERRLDVNSDKLHILFGGTKVLQHTATNKEQGCVGYVLRTGFNTSQGKLLRTILFGVKRVTANNFETFCFIMFLLVFAVLSAWYVWNKGIEDPKRSRYRLFFECTVIITSVVPPELPIELSLAVNTSLLSLSKLYIFCTEPFRIPFAGKVEYCCFDKTGTLTSDDLIVEGVAGVPKSSDDEESLENVTSNDQQEIEKKVIKSTLQKTNTDSLAEHELVTTIERCPQSTLQILASCHSLAHLDEKLVGDPLERKVLEAINWNYSKSGTVAPKKGRAPPLKIHQRFHFNSTLKRMSVVSSYKLDMSNENIYICTSKGAPEFMRPLMKNLPHNYDDLYLQMSRLGARVLALGYRTLGQLSHQELSELKREDVERELMFAGFLLISCPLKPDSKAVSQELADSGHRLVMITGDGALTACHVASILSFVKKEVLILTKDVVNNGSKIDNWNWVSTDQKTIVPFEDSLNEFLDLSRKFDLCLTGDSLNFIIRGQKEKLAYEMICRVKVFARVSPKQKEYIVTSIKSRGKTVLMCGDGTNDVGALKHAHVGVALLSCSSSPVSRTAKPRLEVTNNAVDENSAPSKQVISRKPGSKGPNQGPSNRKVVALNNSTNTPPHQLSPEERKREKILEAQAKLKAMLEEQDRAQFVKLGDASIAAPFTSRLSSTQCISHIIKQGRCTLVTTLQMFKILALNALLSAYCHSVLYLDGIKFSDGQFTLQGLLSTMCFLFITRSQPLKKLSAQRPLPNIFNIYTILTVTLQFVVHFSSLIFLYNQAKMFQDTIDKQNATLNSPIDLIKDVSNQTVSDAIVKNETLGANESDSSSSLHTEFKASLINSTVYIIWMSVQLATFVVNYKGHPFMQNLRNNRPLCYSFIISTFVIFVCVNGWSPSLTEQLSVVEFPVEFRPVLLATIVLDFMLAYVIDRTCEYLFGRLKLKPL